MPWVLLYFQLQAASPSMLQKSLISDDAHQGTTTTNSTTADSDSEAWQSLKPLFAMPLPRPGIPRTSALCENPDGRSWRGWGSQLDQLTTLVHSL